MANAYKKFRVFNSTNKATGQTHGLTLEAFVRFLEEVGLFIGLFIGFFIGLFTGLFTLGLTLEAFVRFLEEVSKP